MRRMIGFVIPAVLVLAACTGTGPTPTQAPVQAPNQTPPPMEQAAPTVSLAYPTSAASNFNPSATVPANCASEDANKIGASIASSYPFTTTQQVMTWFCQGAEFEDILTALETQELTGTAAVDMLQMRADGLTWDEIWQVVGLTVK